MEYSLNGVGYMIEGALNRIRNTSPSPQEFRDSALLNYIKQWLEWRYFNLHQRDIQVDDVYLTIVQEPVPNLVAELVLKFEVKIRDKETSEATWKYGKLTMPFSLGQFTPEFDSKMEMFLIGAMEKWVSQVDPDEYVAPSDFLDIKM